MPKAAPILPPDPAPVGTMVMGLDLGLRTGWAILDAAGIRLHSGVLRFNAYPNPIIRARFVRDRLTTLIAARGRDVTHVGYEMVRRHEGTQAAHVYGGLQWAVLSAMWQHQASLTALEVAEAKRTATGKGNADKDAMLAAARRRWGDVADHNEADALWIAETLRRRIARDG